MADPRKIKQELKQDAVTMLDREGQTVTVSPNDAHEGYMSGKLAYVPGETYVVQDAKSGRMVRVDADTAARTSDDNPYTYHGGTVRDAARQDAEDEYGGVGGTLRTAGEAAIDELSLGGVPALASGLLGEEYQARRQLQEEVNPNTDTLGRVGGLALGLLTGGSEAKALKAGGEAVAGAEAAGGLLRGAGRVVGAPTRGVLAAGEAGGRGARALAEGLGAAEGGLMARAAEGAGRTGAEMGLFSAGSELSRQAVHDPGYDAEKLVSAALEGGAAGAVVGAALPLAGAALRSAGDRAMATGRKLGEAALDKAAEMGGGLVAKHEGEALSMARREALKSTGAKGKLLKGLTGETADLSAQGERMADRVLSDLEATAGKPLGTVTKEEGLQWAVMRRGEAIEALDRTVSAVEQVGARPDLTEVMKGLAGTVKRLEATAGTKAEARAAADFYKDFAATFGEKGENATLADLRRERIALKDKASFDNPAPTALKQMWRETSALLEKEAEATVARAGDPELVKAYKEAKNAYSDFTKLEKMYGEGLGRMRSNRLGGFSEQMALSGGGPISKVAGGLGAAAGGLMGGVPGAFVGKELAGAVGKLGDAFVQRRVKTQGSAIAAKGLRDIGQGKNLVEAGIDGAKQLVHLDPVEAGATDGARKLLKGIAGAGQRTYQGVVDLGRGAAKAARPGVLQGGAEVVRDVDARRKTQAVAEQAAAVARVQGQAVQSAAPIDQPLRAEATRVAQSVEKLLSEPEVPPGNYPIAVKMPSSGTHADKLDARRQVLEKPGDLLRIAAKGELTSDQLASYAVAYPKSLQKSREILQLALAGLKKEPDVGNMVSMSMILGKPADPSLDPKVLGSWQKTLTEARGSAQETGKTPPQSTVLPRAQALSQGMQGMSGVQ